MVDLEREILIYGRLKDGYWSPHQMLARTLELGTDPTCVVGGHLFWEKDEKLLRTNEHTGHFYQLWTVINEARFLEIIGRLFSGCGVKHEHARY